MVSKRGKKKSFWRSLRDFMFPHHENKRHPHLFRNGAVLFVIVLVLVVEGVSVFRSINLTRSATQIGAVLPAVIIALTDGQRTTNQLPTLATNMQLEEAAQAAANDMAEKGYFAHVSPSGATPWSWLIQVGYQYQYAGENLAVNFDDSQQLVDAWMSSPTRCRHGLRYVSR
jgi:hypothetical protein